MPSFSKTGTLKNFQKFVGDIYALPDDRLYSLWDLLTQQQRFTMRALKGIRKGNLDKVKTNLLIAFSWLNAISNRFHVDLEQETWQRFPTLCTYCGSAPCVCKKTHPTERLKVEADESKRPTDLKGYQDMFNNIYPADSRTLADAGVHLAEEMGEVSEAIHNYLGQHKLQQFDDVRVEIADYVSCIFGVANSAKIDVAQELSEMFSNNCHICHQAPCVCNFSEVAQLRT